LKGNFVRCPSYGSRKVVSRGGVERTFKSLPVGGKPTFIVMRVPRVECARCGIVRQVAVPFADGRGRMTHSLERYVADLCRHMTMQAVATHLGLRWETVKDVQRDWLARKFRFHVMKLANHAVDKVRRRVTRKASDEARADIKGKRWLLLKNYESLDSGKREAESLDELMAAQAELAFTYLMKEQLRDFWKLKDVDDAKTFLAEWLASAADSGIPELETLGETLARHEIGLLSRWLFPVSNGIAEGTNNKIKTMARQAYGFRDKEFLKLKIMAIHLAEYELVG